MATDVYKTVHLGIHEAYINNWFVTMATDVIMISWKEDLLCLLLFYAIAILFQLYHGDDMMYEVRRRKFEPTILPTQGIFNLSHYIGTVWEELAFDDAVSHTQRGNGLQHS